MIFKSSGSAQTIAYLFHTAAYLFHTTHDTTISPNVKNLEGGRRVLYNSMNFGSGFSERTRRWSSVRPRFDRTLPRRFFVTCPNLQVF